MTERRCDRCGSPVHGLSGRQTVTLSLVERPRELKFSFKLCPACADKVRHSFMSDPLRKQVADD
ncbi:MAG TPA: hypothetical protein VJ787_11055 [Thermoleophilia bacterium]|nr:hypothetical protein [Thermoleophilia bacterium]